MWSQAMSQNPSNKNLEDKLDSIAEDVVVIRIMMAKQEGNLSRNTDSLETHMARTLAAENRIEMLKTDIDKLDKHKERVIGALQILMVVGAIATFLFSSGILKRLV